MVASDGIIEARTVLDRYDAFIPRHRRSRHQSRRLGRQGAHRCRSQPVHQSTHRSYREPHFRPCSFAILHAVVGGKRSPPRRSWSAVEVVVAHLDAEQLSGPGLDVLGHILASLTQLRPAKGPAALPRTVSKGTKAAAFRVRYGINGRCSNAHLGGEHE